MALSLTLPQGTLHYRDVGPKSAPVLVFVHGLLVSGSLWDGVVDRLDADFRCIVPDWPLGSHREAMLPDADLSPLGIAKMIAAFLEALDLEDVVLVGNDSGGAITQIAITQTTARERVSAVVLTTCDAFEVFPPSPFGLLQEIARVPTIFRTSVRAMRAAPILTRLPFAYGRVTKQAIDATLVDSWLRPVAEDARVCRDVCKFLRGLSSEITQHAAKLLRDFTAPVLVLWTPEERSFPLSLGERLVKTLPNAKLELVHDALVFVALDQPARTAEAIGCFVRQNVVSRSRPSTCRRVHDLLDT
jgi:pimeloyl-ACP methyl ester carboxylesterase